MRDPNSTSRPEMTEVAGCRLDWHAESLLLVIAPMLQAMEDAQSGSIESVRQLYDAKQKFRECVISLRSSLSADETGDLLELAVISLCERLADSGAPRYG